MSDDKEFQITYGYRRRPTFAVLDNTGKVNSQPFHDCDPQCALVTNIDVRELPGGVWLATATFTKLDAPRPGVYAEADFRRSFIIARYSLWQRFTTWIKG